MRVSMELYDAVTHVDEQQLPRASFQQTTSVPMPPEVRNLPALRTPDYYAAGTGLGMGDLNELNKSLLKISNSIVGEMHSRASFAVSCLILVLVGCALGMMFRSGNFLSAFAVSVMPALMTITLIGAGQQTAENIPDLVLSPTFHNPLQLGLTLIWSGNVIVCFIATWLLWKLQKQ